MKKYRTQAKLGIGGMGKSSETIFCPIVNRDMIKEDKRTLNLLAPIQSELPGIRPRGQWLMQMHETRERALPQPVELLAQRLDLRRVPLRGVEETPPLLYFRKRLDGLPGLRLVLLDATSTADDLLRLSRFAGIATRCRGPQTANVLALHNVLLQLVQLILQHLVLRDLGLRRLFESLPLLLQRAFFRGCCGMEMPDLALERLGLGLLAVLVASLEDRLQVLGDAEHVDVLGALFEVDGLHDEHLVLPIEERELPAEIAHGLELLDLLFADLEDAAVAGLEDLRRMDGEEEGIIVWTEWRISTSVRRALVNFELDRAVSKRKV